MGLLTSDVGVTRLTGQRSSVIRCASVHPVLKESSAEVLTSLLRRNAPVPVGSSDAEGFASARLTLSLHDPSVLTPTLLLGIVGSSGATDFCRTRPFQSVFEFFSSCFALLGLLLHPCDL